MKRRYELLKRREQDWKNLKIESYANKPYYTAVDGNELIKEVILSQTPFLVGKFGETELRTVYTFQNEWFRINNIRHVSVDICNNAGFFPKKINAIKSFCKEYIAAMGNMDYLGMSLWKGEEYYASVYGTSLLGIFSMGVLDPLLIDEPWISALAQKRVLIIHPFSESISKQYHNNRRNIFANSSMSIPEFDLYTIKAVQSIGGKGVSEFKTWFEALDYMKMQIDKIDFDIALLGCGAYGLPLGSYIKKKGKQAIHMGGSLQLMFGILGKRWENRDYVKRYVNEYWVRPSQNETPNVFRNIEDGCYW